jgi:hypothetical protein
MKNNYIEKIIQELSEIKDFLSDELKQALELNQKEPSYENIIILLINIIKI